jgi:hypothetical protein
MLKLNVLVVGFGLMAVAACSSESAAPSAAKAEQGLFGGIITVDTANQFTPAVKFNSFSGNVFTNCGGSIISKTRVLTATHCLLAGTNLLRARAEINGGGFFEQTVIPGNVLFKSYTPGVTDGGSEDVTVVQFLRRFDLAGFPSARPIPATSSAANWSHFEDPAFLVGYGLTGEKPREFGQRTQQNIVRSGNGLLEMPANVGSEFLQGESGSPTYLRALDNTFASEGVAAGGLATVGVTTIISPFGGGASVDVGALRTWAETAIFEPSDTAVYGWGSVSLNDRVRLFETEYNGTWPAPAKLGNAGSGTGLGADASVSTVYAAGSVSLRSRAHATRVWAGGRVTLEQDASAPDQLQNQRTALFGYSWFNVNFPAQAGVANFATGTGVVVTPQAGVHHGTLTAQPGTQVVFGEGDYYFDRLWLEPQVAVQFPTAGNTRIYVKNEFLNRSAFGSRNRAESVFLAVLSGNATLQAQYWGTVLVANGKLTVETPGCNVCSPYIGGFYGRDIEIHQGTYITRRPFTGDWL